MSDHSDLLTARIAQQLKGLFSRQPTPDYTNSRRP